MQKGNIRIQGYRGRWYVVDEKTIGDEKLYLLEHETYGDETAGLIINSDYEVICDDVWNGFDDYYEREGIEV